MTKPTAETLKSPHLLIDTANETLSLAIVVDGKVLAAFQEAVFRDMAARLQVELQNVLKQANLQWADLAGVLFNTGPGSFTSIRIGLAAAKALELSLKLPLYGLNGMQALAWPHRGQVVTTLLEAVGQDVYVQSFHAGGVPLADPITQTLAEALADKPAGALTVGNTPEVTVRKAVAAPLDFWQLYAEGFAHTPPKPAYVRPLTYQKVAR